MVTANADLAHLVPGAQAAALLPDAERLALLRTERWWIAHDRAEAALARLAALLRDGPGQIRPPNLLLAGPTNNGKSWIVERFVRAHALPAGEDAERLPVVAMQMPTEPTVVRFYAALLAHLGAPVARAGPGARKHELEQLAVQVLRGVGARVLIIDELHNMLGGTRTSRSEFLNLLRWLGNELRIPPRGRGNPGRLACDPHRPATGKPVRALCAASVAPRPRGGAAAAGVCNAAAVASGLKPARRRARTERRRAHQWHDRRGGGTAARGGRGCHHRWRGVHHPGRARPCQLSWSRRAAT